MKKKTVKAAALGAVTGTMIMPGLGTMLGAGIGAACSIWNGLPEDLALNRRKVEPPGPGLIARLLALRAAKREEDPRLPDPVEVSPQQRLLNERRELLAQVEAMDGRPEEKETYREAIHSRYERLLSQI